MKSLPKASGAQGFKLIRELTIRARRAEKSL
jgi:hypothetical protein